MALTQMLRPPIKVFIDSSVLIAAAISPTGAARILLISGLIDEALLFFSDDVFEETERNLRKKYPEALPALRLFREAFAGQTVRPTQETIHRAAALVVAKDAPILGGAIAAGTDYLVTFDRQHLLSVAAEILDTFGIIVATPSEILHLRGGDPR